MISTQFDLDHLIKDLSSSLETRNLFLIKKPAAVNSDDTFHGGFGSLPSMYPTRTGEIFEAATKLMDQIE